MDSISFPAIGTGNLGYPKDLVASLMLDEILAFSQEKKPVHLKEVAIMLFPGDRQTLQVKLLKKNHHQVIKKSSLTLLIIKLSIACCHV